MRRMTGLLLALSVGIPLTTSGCSSPAVDGGVDVRRVASVETKPEAKPSREVAKVFPPAPAAKRSVATDATLVSAQGAKQVKDVKPTRKVVAQAAEAKKAESGQPFALPDDAAGQLLGKVLPPRSRVGAFVPRTQPGARPTTLPRFVQPTPPLPPGITVVARMPDPMPKVTLQPRGLLVERFGEALDAPALPKTPTFEAEKKTAVPSEDVSIPPPLPILAVPLLDRVAVDDFTVEASIQAVLTAPLPRREEPAPFTKAGVPEPFENRRPLGTKNPDEKTTPVADGPAIPGK